MVYTLGTRYCFFSDFYMRACKYLIYLLTFTFTYIRYTRFYTKEYIPISWNCIHTTILTRVNGGDMAGPFAVLSRCLSPSSQWHQCCDGFDSLWTLGMSLHDAPPLKLFSIAKGTVPLQPTVARHPATRYHKQRYTLFSKPTP